MADTIHFSLSIRARGLPLSFLLEAEKTRDAVLSLHTFL